MSEFDVAAAAPYIPDGINSADGLEAMAVDEGVRNVSHLLSAWASGEERYDRSGEQLLVAIDKATQTVVGIGGLSLCPDVESALRVRRFYVAPNYRRRGVARALAQQLIDHGLQHTATLSCNARASAAAKPFWESMGFQQTTIAGITHIYSAK